MTTEAGLIDGDYQTAAALPWSENYSYGLEFNQQVILDGFYLSGAWQDAGIPTGWSSDANEFSIYDSIDGSNWLIREIRAKPALVTLAENLWACLIKMDVPYTARYFKLSCRSANGARLYSPGPGEVNVQIAEVRPCTRQALSLSCENENVLSTESSEIVLCER